MSKTMLLRAVDGGISFLQFEYPKKLEKLYYDYYPEFEAELEVYFMHYLKDIPLYEYKAAILQMFFEQEESDKFLNSLKTVMEEVLAEKKKSAGKQKKKSAGKQKKVLTLDLEVLYALIMDYGYGDKTLLSKYSAQTISEVLGLYYRIDKKYWQKDIRRVLGLNNSVQDLNENSTYEKWVKEIYIILAKTYFKDLDINLRKLPTEEVQTYAFAGFIGQFYENSRTVQTINSICKQLNIATIDYFDDCTSIEDCIISKPVYGGIMLNAFNIAIDGFICSFFEENKEDSRLNILVSQKSDEDLCRELLVEIRKTPGDEFDYMLMAAALALNIKLFSFMLWRESESQAYDKYCKNACLDGNVITEYETKIKKKDDNIDKLSRQIVALKKEYEPLKKEKLKNKESEAIKDLSHEVSELRRKIERLEGEIEKKNKQIRELENSISEDEIICLDEKIEPDYESKYLFVVSDEVLSARLKESFPNSVISEDGQYEITESNYQGIKACAIITKAVKHCEVYRCKDTCKNFNIPIVNINYNNVTKIAEELAVNL